MQCSQNSSQTCGLSAPSSSTCNSMQRPEQISHRGMNYMIDPSVVESKQNTYEGETAFADLRNAFNVDPSSPLHMPVHNPVLYQNYQQSYPAQSVSPSLAMLMESQSIQPKTDVELLSDDRVVENMVNEIAPELAEKATQPQLHAGQAVLNSHPNVYPFNRTMGFNPDVLGSNLLEGYMTGHQYREYYGAKNELDEKMKVHRSTGMTILIILVLIVLAYVGYVYVTDYCNKNPVMPASPYTKMSVTNSSVYPSIQKAMPRIVL